MRPVVIAVLAIWAVFWCYWIGSAFTAKASRHDLDPRGLPVRIGLGVVTVVILRLLHRAEVRLGVHAAPVIAVGFVLLLAGLGLAVWARLHLGRNWGMPTTQRVAPELITSGPYTHVRHPIYTGLLLAGIGTATAINLTGLAVVVIVSVYFIYAARIEEQNLTRVFGDAYPAYVARSKMLIPFLL